MDSSTLSILECLELGRPIDLNGGAFGKPGEGNCSVTVDDLCDARILSTGDAGYTLFDGKQTDRSLSNVPSEIVPGNERWDLYGLQGYFMPATTGGSLTEANFGLFRQLVRSGRVGITLGSLVIMNQPMFPLFGSMGFNTTFASTVTAAVGPAVTDTWKRQWPQKLFFTCSATTKMTFTVTFSAGYTVASGLNTMYLGFSFPRVKAAKV